MRCYHNGLTQIYFFAHNKNNLYGPLLLWETLRNNKYEISKKHPAPLKLTTDSLILTQIVFLPTIKTFFAELCSFGKLCGTTNTKYHKNTPHLAPLAPLNFTTD